MRQGNCLTKCIADFFFFYIYTTNSHIDHMACSILFPFTTLMGNVYSSLSQEGLFNLLDSIEGRLHDEQTSVYGDSSIDERQLNRLIRYTPTLFLQTYLPYLISPRLKLNAMYIYIMATEQFVQMRKTYYPSAKGSHFR